jgi:hypothetical protein
MRFFSFDFRSADKGFGGVAVVFCSLVFCGSAVIDRRYRLIAVVNATFLDNREVRRIDCG